MVVMHLWDRMLSGVQMQFQTLICFQSTSLNMQLRYVVWWKHVNNITFLCCYWLRFDSGVLPFMHARRCNSLRLLPDLNLRRRFRLGSGNSSGLGSNWHLFVFTRIAIFFCDKHPKVEKTIGHNNKINETAVGLHVYRKGPPICLHPPMSWARHSSAPITFLDPYFVVAFYEWL